MIRTVLYRAWPSAWPDSVCALRRASGDVVPSAAGSGGRLPALGTASIGMMSPQLGAELRARLVGGSPAPAPGGDNAVAAGHHELSHPPQHLPQPEVGWRPASPC